LQRKQKSYGANGNGGTEEKGEAGAIVRETKCLRCVSRGVRWVHPDRTGRETRYFSDESEGGIDITLAAKLYMRGRI